MSYCLNLAFAAEFEKSMSARQRGAHVLGYHTDSSNFSSNQIGHEHLEEDNEHAESELASKITGLKSLSIQIGEEVREHNRLLKDVDDEFDSTFGQLQHNIQRVIKLVKSGSRYYMFYLFLFILFVVFVIWCLI